MARRILIGRTDWAQDPAAVLSGGFWSPGLPLANLLDPRPQFVAEAITNIDWAATQFRIDLGYQRKVGLFHFANLRASALGLMQLRASLASDLSSPTYDSGIVSCRPLDSTPFGYTPWGRYTVSGAYDEDEYVALGLPRFFIPDAIIDCRYLLVEIMDSTAVSPLQIGCFGAYEIWEPPLNFTYGWTVTPMDESDVQRVPYGSTYISARGIRRRLSLGFPLLPETEVLSRSLGLALIKGRSQPLVAVPFPDDAANREKTAIYGLVSQDSAISNPFFARYAHPFQIDQLR